MINNNKVVAGISTDYEIASILNNFSDFLITDMINESIKYRFRPFGLRLPNYPDIFTSNLNNVLVHSVDHDEEIIEKKEEVQRLIIDTIGENFGFQVSSEIPTEQLYPLCYLLYQIFVSEFTDRMLNFYTQYIIDNMDEILKYIKQDEVTKSSYSKKIYNNQDLGIIYDNMIKVMDIVAALDIRLPELITYLSTQETSDFICSYIEEIDDVYKKNFAVYITSSTTIADVITSVRLKFVQATIENVELLNPNTNPYITKQEPTSPVMESDDILEE